jgi:hypothetical protein
MNMLVSFRFGLMLVWIGGDNDWYNTYT